MEWWECLRNREYPLWEVEKSLPDSAGAFGNFPSVWTWRNCTAIGGYSADSLLTVLTRKCERRQGLSLTFYANFDAVRFGGSFPPNKF